MGDSIRIELGTECREVLQHKRCQETIFSERQQVLLVQRIDVGLRILLYDAVGDDDGSTLIGGTNAVHGETSRKTGDRTEQTLERLGQVV